MSILKPLRAAAFGCSAILAAAAAAQAQKPYDGVTVNVITFTGPQIAEPLQRRGPDFEKLTGAKVNVITVPFSDLYQKLLTDWSTGTNSIDAAVFAPQWMVDYIAGGYLEDLTDRASRPTRPSSRTTSPPFFRDFSPEIQRQDLHDHARWRLPHGLLPHRRPEGGRPEAAQDLGRLSRDRQGHSTART